MEKAWGQLSCGWVGVVLPLATGRRSPAAGRPLWRYVSSVLVSSRVTCQRVRATHDCAVGVCVCVCVSVACGRRTYVSHDECRAVCVVTVWALMATDGRAAARVSVLGACAPRISRRACRVHGRHSHSWSVAGVCDDGGGGNQVSRCASENGSAERVPGARAAARGGSVRLSNARVTPNGSEHTRYK